MRQGPAIHARRRRGARRSSQSPRPRAGGRLDPSRRAVRAGGQPVQGERHRQGRDRARHRGVAAATVRARAVGPRRPRGRVARPAAAGAPGIGTGPRRRARTIAHQRPFRLAGAGGGVGCVGRDHRGGRRFLRRAGAAMLHQRIRLRLHHGRSPAGSGAGAEARRHAWVGRLRAAALADRGCRLCPAPCACVRRSAAGKTLAGPDPGLARPAGAQADAGAANPRRQFRP